VGVVGVGVSVSLGMCIGVEVGVREGVGAGMGEDVDVGVDESEEGKNGDFDVDDIDYEGGDGDDEGGAVVVDESVVDVAVAVTDDGDDVVAMVAISPLIRLRVETLVLSLKRQAFWPLQEVPPQDPWQKKDGWNKMQSLSRPRYDVALLDASFHQAGL
jgi:hypothetical protein